MTEASRVGHDINEVVNTRAGTRGSIDIVLKDQRPSKQIFVSTIVSVKRNHEPNNIRFNVRCKEDISTIIKCNNHNYARVEFCTTSGKSSVILFKQNQPFIADRKVVGGEQKNVLARLRHQLKEVDTCKPKTPKNKQVTTSAAEADSFVEPGAANETISYEEFKRIVYSSNPQEVYRVCTECKLKSIEFQHHICECSDADLDNLHQLMVPIINSLLHHQYGSYAVQKLMTRNLRFREFVSNYCLANLSILARHEFPSRVMQGLVELSPQFCRNILIWLRNHPGELWSHISTAFLACTAIRFAESEELYSFVLDLIAKKEAIVIRRYFKRVLISLVENCQLETLKRLYRILSGCYDFFHGGEDRFLLHIFKTFIFRGLEQPVKDLAKELAVAPQLLLKSKAMASVLIQISECDWISGRQLIHSSLLSTWRAGFTPASVDPRVWSTFAYIVLRLDASGDLRTPRALLDAVNSHCFT